MEKIFIAIILLNILASILASRRKKKKLREAAEKRAQADTDTKSKSKKKVHKPLFRVFDSKEEKPHARPAVPAQTPLESGKNLLDQVAKELGLRFESSQSSPPPPPPTPAENPGFMEIISEPTVPELLKQPEAPISYDQMAEMEEEPSKTRADTTYGFPATLRLKHHIILEKLRNRGSFKEAFILKTIIDKPLGLQKQKR